MSMDALLFGLGFLAAFGLFITVTIVGRRVIRRWLADRRGANR